MRTRPAYYGDSTHDDACLKKIEQVLEQLSQVTDHVRVIQETTNTTNDLLKYRIEEAFTDIQRFVVGVLSASWTGGAK